MPITVPSQIERFAAMSGAELPRDVVGPLLAVADSKEKFREVGVDLITQVDPGAPEAAGEDAGRPPGGAQALKSGSATAEVVIAPSSDLRVISEEC